jgi:hypothetical protein
MRKAWMDYVAKTRKKGNRGKGNTMTHKEALKTAAVTWPKEKAKIMRRKMRECKKRPAAAPPVETLDVPVVENAQS